MPVGIAAVGAAKGIGALVQGIGNFFRKQKEKKAGKGGGWLQRLFGKSAEKKQLAYTKEQEEAKLKAAGVSESRTVIIILSVIAGLVLVVFSIFLIFRSKK